MGTRRTSGHMCTPRTHGMRLMAPAGPDSFIRRPHLVHNLRGWTPARGTDAATKAPHPVRWSHNRRTARRRVRCGGRDRQKRDTEYPGECRREHISFPCVPPWVGKIRVPYLSEPHHDCQEGSHFFIWGSTAFMQSPLGVRSGCVSFFPVGAVSNKGPVLNHKGHEDVPSSPGLLHCLRLTQS